MARRMPSLARVFCSAADEALGLAGGVEEARSVLAADADNRTYLSPFRVELAYELAYLRVFIAWEEFLEESFLRYMCGYCAAHGQETLVTGSFLPTLGAARATLQAGRQYMLWHNPQSIIDRARQRFRGARHETVILSIQGRLTSFAAVRHRIAHAQSHAKQEFDAATMALVGKRYRGSRPGRFLRDWAPAQTPPKRWLHIICSELKGLSHQITPI